MAGWRLSALASKRFIFLTERFMEGRARLQVDTDQCHFPERAENGRIWRQTMERHDERAGSIGRRL
jgi:hypothetical protein